MVGRKRRQNIKRQPNGQPSRVKDGDPKAIAQLMPHRRLVPAEVAHDPKAESLLGRLCLNGWISEIQYQAGVKFRTAQARYRTVIEAPRSSEASMSGVIVGPWGGSVIPEERQIEIRKDYMAAFEALEEATGSRGARSVSHCINDKHPFSIPHVNSGLTALAIFYGLTKAGKAASAINRC